MNSLLETESCPVFYDCLTYHWTTSAWGQCKLKTDNPSVFCGLGIQTRTVECYSSEGVKAPDKYEFSA